MEIIVVDMKIDIGIPIKHASEFVRTEKHSICDYVANTQLTKNTVDIKKEVAHRLFAARRHCPATVHPVWQRAVRHGQVTAKVPRDAIRPLEDFQTVQVHEKLCLFVRS